MDAGVLFPGANRAGLEVNHSYESEEDELRVHITYVDGIRN